MFVVTVIWKAKPDHASAFAERLILQAHNSLANEPNCLQFDVAADPDDPTCYFLYEVYRAPSDFDAHLASDHFLKFSAESEAMVDEKTIQLYHRVAPET